MKLALIPMMLCLTACQAVTVEAAFKDVQRNPPDLKPETADYLIQHDRHVAEWIVETKRKCQKFKCQK